MIDLSPNTISQYSSKGILVDANLLFLLILGIYDRSQILTNTRTKDYTIDDFELLYAFLDKFQKILTIPNVLTEVSNLSTKMESKRRKQFLEFLRGKIELLDEIYVESKQASKQNGFERLGLTDTAIAVFSAKKNLILTADFNLYRHLASEGLAAINFNHIRTLGWR